MTGFPHHVVKIPLPPNVDPDFRLELRDRDGGPNWDGLHVGACLDKDTQYEAYSRLSDTIYTRIPHGSTVLIRTSSFDLQYVTRSVLPGEQLDFHDTRDQVALIYPQSWGQIVMEMVSFQRNWWTDKMKKTPPQLWGDGTFHPVWTAWAQEPYPEKLWYVAIRRTLPQDGLPAYYFPEAELRFY